MSAPVMPAAPPPVATLSVQTSAEAAPAANDGFSRILADQRQAADNAPPRPNNMSAAADAPRQSRHAERAPSVKTPGVDDGSDVTDVTNVKVRLDKHDATRINLADDAQPDASLAALTLDIARQTAAQLRGAALRAGGQQTGGGATTIDRFSMTRPDGLTVDHADPTRAAAWASTPALAKTPWLPPPTTDHTAARRQAGQTERTGQTFRTSKTAATPFEPAAPDRFLPGVELPRDTALTPAAAHGHDFLPSTSHAATAEPTGHASPRLDFAAPLPVAAPLGSR